MILKLNETKSYPMVYKIKNTATGAIVELVNLEPIESDSGIEIEAGSSLYHVTKVIEKRVAKVTFGNDPVPDFYKIEINKVGTVRYTLVDGVQTRTTYLD